MGMKRELPTTFDSASRLVKKPVAYYTGGHTTGRDMTRTLLAKIKDKLIKKIKIIKLRKK